MQMLNLSRNLLTLVDSVEGGARNLPSSYAVKGKRVTLVGLGGIGHAVLSRHLPFQCALEVVTRTPEKAQLSGDIPVYGLFHLPTAVREADFVICCLRVDQHNADLFNSVLFQQMKRGSVFLNVARGSHR